MEDSIKAKVIKVKAITDRWEKTAADKTLPGRWWFGRETIP